MSIFDEETVFLTEPNAAIFGPDPSILDIPTVICEDLTVTNSMTVDGVTLATDTIVAPAMTLSYMQAVSAAPADIPLALLPKGTGGLMVSYPDNLAAGGTSRGFRAVDLQFTRTAASQVASGDDSFLGGTTSCTVSGASAAIIGANNISVDSLWSVAAGGTNSSIITAPQSALFVSQGCTINTGINLFALGCSTINMLDNTRVGAINSLSAGPVDITLSTDVTVIGTNTMTINGCQRAVVSGGQLTTMTTCSDMFIGGCLFADATDCVSSAALSGYGSLDQSNQCAMISSTAVGAISTSSYSLVIGAAGNITGSNNSGVGFSNTSNIVTSSYSLILSNDASGTINTCISCVLVGSTNGAIANSNYSLFMGANDGNITGTNTSGVLFSNTGIITNSSHSALIANSTTCSIVGNGDIIASSTGCAINTSNVSAVISTRDSNITNNTERSLIAASALITTDTAECLAAIATQNAIYTNVSYCAALGCLGGDITDATSCVNVGSTNAQHLTNSGYSVNISSLGCVIRNSSTYSASISSESGFIDSSIRSTVISSLSSTITNGANDCITACDTSLITGLLGSCRYIMSSFNSNITAGTNQASVIASTTSGINTSSYSCVVASDNNTITGGVRCLAKGTQIALTNSTEVTALGDNINVTGLSNIFVFGDGSAATAPPNSNSFVVRTTGATAAIFYSNAASTTGVSLAAGANAWAAVSDRNVKENIVEVNPADYLQMIDNMPIYTYNFIGNKKEQRCIGPMAQDWNPAFETLKDPLKIDSGDVQGVLLAAVKALSAQNKELFAQNKKLEERIARLESMVQ